MLILYFVYKRVRIHMARGPANGVSSTGNALHLIDSSDSFVLPTVLAY